MAGKKVLDADKLNFVLENKDTMKQCEIARLINVSPTTVNQIIKGKRYSGGDCEVFDVVSFGKMYNY